ncbi:MAG TPA: sulfotransferase [Dongiaceae bacterium]|jgi:hypothetical protein
MQVAGGSTTGDASTRLADVEVSRKRSGWCPWSVARLSVGAPASAITAPKFVCILGIARTGTNHLARILSDIPEIDSRRELFNPRRCWSMRPDELSELSRRSGKVFPCSPEDTQAVREVRRRPALMLDCLADRMAPEKKILCFKVFKDQLSMRQVRTAIISRPDTIIVFIRRRPIDAYVSQRKACLINTWQSVDTTQIKVDIDAGRYIRWWRGVSKWYRGLEAACQSVNKRFHELSYEDDVDCAPAEAARRFCAMLERSGVGPLTVPESNPPVGLSKQDRNRDIADRVSNWAEFHHALVAKGCLDTAFAPFPHYQPTWWNRAYFRLRG